MGIHTGQILYQRYQVGELIGKGQAKTFAGSRLADDIPVVIKELKFSEMDNWKAYELFQREMNTLKSLNHRAFPKLFDYFEDKNGDDQWMYLVLERLPGQNLQESMKAGWRPTPQEVKRLATQALEALVHLHQLAPPLIHRDIKPSNLIWHEQQLYLIDFGAVQDMLRPEGSSTIVGTFGYMAPEQFSGRAVPASDLYGLGATLVHLLSGKNPGEMPQRELRLDFRPYITCVERFSQWLERMLEPMIEYRFRSAQEALDSLLNEEAIQPSVSKSLRRDFRSAETRTLASLQSRPSPVGTKAEVKTGDQQLQILIPAGGFGLSSLFLIGFNAFWLCFVAVWTLFALQGSILFALFSIPFWAVGLGMLAFNMNSIFTRVKLHFSSQHIEVTKNYAGVFKSQQHYPLSQLSSIQRNLSYKSNNVPHFALQIELGAKKINLGTHLSRMEQEWLENEILVYTKDHLPTRQMEQILRFSDSTGA